MGWAVPNPSSKAMTTIPQDWRLPTHLNNDNN